MSHHNSHGSSLDALGSHFKFNVNDLHDIVSRLTWMAAGGTICLTHDRNVVEVTVSDGPSTFVATIPGTSAGALGLDYDALASALTDAKSTQSCSCEHTAVIVPIDDDTAELKVCSRSTTIARRALPMPPGSVIVDRGNLSLALQVAPDAPDLDLLYVSLTKGPVVVTAASGTTTLVTSVDVIRRFGSAPGHGLSLPAKHVGRVARLWTEDTVRIEWFRDVTNRMGVDIECGTVRLTTVSQTSSVAKLASLDTAGVIMTMSQHALLTALRPAVESGDQTIMLGAGARSLDITFEDAPQAQVSAGVVFYSSSAKYMSVKAVSFVNALERLNGQRVQLGIGHSSSEPLVVTGTDDSAMRFVIEPAHI